MPIVFSMNGPNFTPRTIEILKNVKSGSKVIFDNIKAEGPDGKIIRNIPGITIKVKG